MKTLILTILCLILLSCKQKSKNVINTDEFRYSAYSLHYNTVADSFEFYLAHHININKNGHFVIMRHESFKDKEKYYTGDLNASSFPLINSILEIDSFKNDNARNNTNGSIYDGFTYCIDYKSNKNNLRRQIQFIPMNCPAQINSLVHVLDSIIFNSKIPNDTLNLTEYSAQLNQLFIPNKDLLPKRLEFVPKIEN
jgi:hypothetical protein